MFQVTKEIDALSQENYNLYF